jgi:hypothetical protein
MKNSTDSASLIDTITKIQSFQNNWYTNIFTWHHIDVVQQIYFAISDLAPLKIAPFHVKGHSDDKKQAHQQSRDEQIKVLCDESATDELNQQKQNNVRPSFYPLPQTTCYLQPRGRFVTSHEDKILLWSQPEQTFMSYLATKYKWFRPTRQIINWTAFTSAKT